MSTARVVKTKWDGTIATVSAAQVLSAGETSWVWLKRAGSQRERPGSDLVEILDTDELWVAVPGEWWVLCVHTDAARSVSGFLAHASAPFEPPPTSGEIGWIDLDLDFEVAGDHIALRDEADLHEHARTMGMPPDVVRGAWSGIAVVAARFTNEEWPFDGSLQGWLDATSLTSGSETTGVRH